MAGPAMPALKGRPTSRKRLGSMPAHIVLPWVHRVFSNLKRWALGVYHGLRKKHVQTYLDEFVFRFNRRKNRPAGFVTLHQEMPCKSPASTYKMLIAAGANGISLIKDIKRNISQRGRATHRQRSCRLKLEGRRRLCLGARRALERTRRSPLCLGSEVENTAAGWPDTKRTS